MSTPDNPTPPFPPSPRDGGAFPAFPRYPQPGPSQEPEGDHRPFAGQGPDPDAFAGFWIRLLGVVIDGLLLTVVTGTVDRIVTGGAAVGFVVAGAYFTYFHSTPAGQTLGNRVVGIRVVDAGTGGHLDHVRALLRWLMSYVSGIALFIGYLWMLWDPAKQTWHDLVANSYVVKASHHPPPAEFGKRASSATAQ